MTTHTDGPWLVREGFSTDTFEVYPRRGGKPEIGSWAELATVRSDYGNDAGDTAEGEANARLIAAAPDLLEVVKAFEAFYPSGINPYLDEASNKARAALAKAIPPESN